MNKTEIKIKLRSLIRDLILLDLDNNQEIPESIGNYFLESCNLQLYNQKPKPEDLNNFTLRLHKYIEEKYLMNDSGKKQEICDADLDYKKFLETESEYNEVTGELVKMLEKSTKMKERASEHFKDECKAQGTKIDVLQKKCEFLKKQLFVKFYGEENALSGHLILRDILRKKLDCLQKEFTYLVELNKKYDEVEHDQVFQDLLMKYKELRKIEKRSEIISDIL